MAQPATLARLARHEPRREDASHDGFQLAPEPADAERRAQITTRVEDGPALLLGDAPAARERRATEPRSSRASGGRHHSGCSVWHSWVHKTCVVNISCPCLSEQSGLTPDSVLRALDGTVP